MLPDVKLHWSGTWPIGRGFSLPDDPDLDAGMGVYQIVERPFGDSPVYVGKAYDQSFRRRVPQHAREEVAVWLDRQPDLRLYLRIGHVEVVTGSRISARLVDDIESLLVFAYEPPANVMKTRSYAGGPMVVKNVGRRLPLHRWVAADDEDVRAWN